MRQAKRDLWALQNNARFRDEKTYEGLIDLYDSTGEFLRGDVHILHTGHLAA